MQAAGEEGVVVGELQKGYRFHDRVIRPAMVKVGNGTPSDADDVEDEG
jgi:molecular chaperone GrpE